MSLSLCICFHVFFGKLKAFPAWHDPHISPRTLLISFVRAFFVCFSFFANGMSFRYLLALHMRCPSRMLNHMHMRNTLSLYLSLFIEIMLEEAPSFCFPPRFGGLGRGRVVGRSAGRSVVGGRVLLWLSVFCVLLWRLVCLPILS